MHGCCFVERGGQKLLVLAGSKRITYGPSRDGAQGTMEDVLLDGAKIGFRFFSYD